METSQDAYIKQLEEQVLMLTRLMEVNSFLNSALLRSDVQIEPLLSFLMDAAASITDSESASVLLWDRDQQDLRFAATTSDSSAVDSLLGKPVPLDSIAGEIYKTKSIVQVDDAATDPRHYDKVDSEIEFVTRSLMGTPMVAADDVIGVLEVVNKRQLPWTLNDRNNLSMLANEAAVAIRVAQLMLDMQKANEELSELDKLKSDFIAIVSHELRTPLGIILGYATFLEDSEDESVSEQASRVTQGALQLRKIIEAMINLRYLKQKPEDLQRTEMTLDMLRSEITNSYMAINGADERELRINVRDGDTPLFIDSTRIVMAITNVLENATSFTQPDGIITIESWRHDNNEVRISIQDDGVGVEEKHLEKIFDDFYQAEDHMVRHHGGLGIGLSITRALIAVHGGRVWASSPGLNQGTTITIALPVHKQSMNS